MAVCLQPATQTGQVHPALSQSLPDAIFPVRLLEQEIKLT
jgi:hypothetical protein